jgi:hypothetical protein
LKFVASSILVFLAVGRQNYGLYIFRSVVKVAYNKRIALFSFLLYGQAICSEPLVISFAMWLHFVGHICGYLHSNICRIKKGSFA